MAVFADRDVAADDIRATGRRFSTLGLGAMRAASLGGLTLFNRPLASPTVKTQKAAQKNAALSF